VAAWTALLYAAVGWAALKLNQPLGLAAPLYPSAGLALAAVLVYGRPALWGAAAGAFLVNLNHALQVGGGPAATWLAPALIGGGAALQAALGAWLVRRHVAQPLTLAAPRDIFYFGLLGAVAACLTSSTVAMLALLGTGAVGPEEVLSLGLTWWTGDALGVLIGAPLALTFIGQPAADWRPRRATLGAPLLVAMLLVGAGMIEFGRLDLQRRQATFQRDVERVANDVRIRLARPVYALQALHGNTRGSTRLERESVAQAALWWLAQPIELQAMGQSVRVPLRELPTFEAEARAKGEPDFKVFDRDGGAARALDQEVLALRYIEPVEQNAAAVGVNALSIPAARAAILATRDSGQPAATEGFGLTQSGQDETGMVLYQALYRGTPTHIEERRAQFRGVVFVTLRAERLVEGLLGPDKRYLRLCLVDADTAAQRRRLAGPVGCDTEPQIEQADARTLSAAPVLELGGRNIEMRITAQLSEVPGRQPEASWLLALSGIAATSLLGALLLTITGNTRRTELAVNLSTTQLRQEISERKQAESDLRDSEERLRSILDNVPLGIVFLDTQGNILESNPTLREAVGCSVAELHRMTVLDLAVPEEAPRMLALRRGFLLKQPRTVVKRVRLRSRNGPDRIVQVTISPLRKPDGQVHRLVCVLEDETEKLRLDNSEKARVRAEAASRAKSDFVSRMSHELRTPLNAMIGFAQLLGLNRDTALSTQEREWVQQIQRAGWHLLDMINETLELARIESGSLKVQVGPVALEPLLQACTAMVTAAAGQRGISVSCSVDEDAAAVLADPLRLKQVLTNLMSNAVKYNREGGALTISARRALPSSAPNTEALSGENTPWVEIAVSDTGLGMTPEQLQALFQPYNRLGRESSGIEGTGIGLVISRSLSQLMGGTLEASSEPQVGSIFTLRLPAAESAEAPAMRYGDTFPAPYRERRVHYVEDNLTNIEVMRGVLAQRPQVLLETSTMGLDGLAAIRNTMPDLILLDMQLPDISGLELLRHLKNDDTVAHIPIIVVSADATQTNIEQALLAGALHYVTKPVDLVPFLTLVDGVLDEQPSRW